VADPARQRGPVTEVARSPVRDRIAAAVLDLVTAGGPEAASVEAVVERAGVTREQYHLHFADSADCYVQLFWQFTADFDRAVFGGFDSACAWRDRLRTAAYGAARYMRDHPRETEFGITQMFAAGEMAQAYRERHLQRLVDLVDAGRQELPDPNSMTRAVAEGALGSIYETVSKQLQEGRGTRSATDFVPELMYLAVRPYLGHEIAREELRIPPPADLTGGGG
jgi:AcrR family transcriptional regulator